MDDTPRGIADSSQIQDNSGRISYDDNFNPDKPESGIPTDLGHLGHDESAQYLPNLPLTTTPFMPRRSDTSFPNDFPLDQVMRQAYTLPPAGTPTRRLLPEVNSPIRKYNMASDIFGTGMDKSWGNEQPNNSTEQSKLQANRKEPESFKITQLPSNNAPSTDVVADGSINQSTNRRARESSGNPLTGTGYDDSNNKTAKRYFEGSNANQKLW